MKKILIIEDEPGYLKLLHDQLIKKGYEVVDAHNGKEGLEIAKKIDPDLILLDIRMPKMDGMSMLDLLREDIKGKSTKVIALTNLEPNESLLLKTIEYKLMYYFIKSDITLEELSGKIKELLAE